MDTDGEAHLEISELRSVSVSPAGDVIIVSNDSGYIRIVRNILARPAAPVWDRLTFIPGTGMRQRWHSVPGSMYLLEHISTLTSGTWHSLPLLPSAGLFTEFTDTTAPAGVDFRATISSSGGFPGSGAILWHRTVTVPAAPTVSHPPIPLTRYAWLSVGAAVTTFLLKLTAWHLTGSVSMLSDALESLANLAAAFFAVASLAVAARPADEDHAYGHSKAEYFASGVEGALIIAAAAGIGWAAVERMFHPRQLSGVEAGLAVSAVASGINFAVARVLLKVSLARRSPALEADAKHLMTDVWTSVVTLAAVAVVAVTDWSWLDPVFGLLLAGHIVATGIKLVHKSALGLMDTAIPAADLAAIRKILSDLEKEGLQYHALRTRQAGARCFMSLHFLVPGAWSVKQAHDRAEALELALRDAVAQLNVITHIEPLEDPLSLRDARLDREPVPGETV